MFLLKKYEIGEPMSDYIFNKETQTIEKCIGLNKIVNIQKYIEDVEVTHIGDSAFCDSKTQEINILGDSKRFNHRWTDIGFPEDLMSE